MAPRCGLCPASWCDQARPGQRVTGELIFALAAYRALSCHLPQSIDSPDNPQRWANIFNNQFSLQMRKPEGACPRLRGRKRGGSSDFSLVVLGKWVRGQGSAQVHGPRSHRRLWGRWVQSRGSLCPTLPHGETLEGPEEELGVSSHLLCFLIVPSFL